MAEVLELTVGGEQEKALDAELDLVPELKLLLLRIMAKALHYRAAAWSCFALGSSMSAINFYLAVDQGQPAQACFVFAYLFFSIAIVVSLRPAVTGDSDDVNETRQLIIPKAEASSLKRWNFRLLVFSSAFLYLGPSKFVAGVLGSSCVGKCCSSDLTKCNPDGSMTAFARLTKVRNGMYFLSHGPTTLAAWPQALKAAAMRVSSKVLALRRTVTSDEWDAHVVPQTPELTTKTLPGLSAEFGQGLMEMWLACWSMGLGLFIGIVGVILKGEDVTTLNWFMFVYCTFLPLLIAQGVAGTSSNCDAIQTALNDKRGEAKTDVATDAKLQVLERHLDRQNRKVGLGFVPGGKVLNKTSLKTIFAAMIGFLSTALPLILNVIEPTAVHGSAGCSPTALEVGVVKSTFLNASWSYDNVTIGSVLRLKTDDDHNRDAVDAPSLSLLNPCTSDTDCQLNGACVPGSGACMCHAGWTGADCGLLDLQPSASTDFPGLAYGKPPSSSSDGGSGGGGLATWGGSVVVDPKDPKKFHLFAAEMSLGCGLNSWYRNSVIVHATAPSPLGPFVRQEQVLDAFAHEPVVVTLPEDKGFVIYKIGCADNATTGSNGTFHGNGTKLFGRCFGCSKNGVTDKDIFCPHPDQVYERECQDVLFSTSLDGPWARQNLSGFETGPGGWAWQDANLGLESHAPIILKNGSLLTFTRAYQGGRQLNPKPPTCSVWTVVSNGGWNGTYRVATPGKPAMEVGLEDTFMWQDPRGNFHALFHSFGGGRLWASATPSEVGGHAFSKNGVDWTFGSKASGFLQDGAYNLDVALQNKTVVMLARRERPHLLLNERGDPAFLTNGVQSAGFSGAPGKDWTYTGVFPICTTARGQTQACPS